MQRPEEVAEEFATEREEVLALSALDEVTDSHAAVVQAVSERPPSIDDYDDYDDAYMEAVPPPVNYPAWTSENSFVVSGPLGNFNWRGRRFDTWDQARAWMNEKYGFIYEEIKLPGRWAGRVPKPKVA